MSDKQEVIDLLNEAQAKIVSVGMHPDFADMQFMFHASHLPATQEDASRLISQALKLLEQ